MTGRSDFTTEGGPIKAREETKAFGAWLLDRPREAPAAAAA